MEGGFVRDGNYASRLKPDVLLVELLELKLCSSELTDELLELEPRLSLCCCKAAAPLAFGETEASSDITELAAELSPDDRAATIARINAAISDEWAEVVALVELALAEDTALCAVESRVCTSFCAVLKSPFCRSVPSRFSSLTNELELVDEAAIADRAVVPMPLSEVVAVEEVTPFCASAESVTQSCCAAARFPLLTSFTNWFRSVTN